MPASKQSGTLKVVLPLVAVLIMFTAVFGPRLFSPNKSTAQNPQQTDAESGDETIGNDESGETQPLDVPDNDADRDGIASDVTDADPINNVEATPGADPTDSAARDTPVLVVGNETEGGPDAWSLRTGALPDTLPLIGSTQVGGGYELGIALDPDGLGIEKITLPNHFESPVDAQNIRKGKATGDEVQYTVDAVRRAKNDVDGTGPSSRLNALGAISVYVYDPATTSAQQFDLRSAGVWTKTGDQEYQATVENLSGDPALVITRRFGLAQDAYELTVEQTVENRSGVPLYITWNQYGPSDLPPERAGYRIETRRVRVGYTDIDDSQYVVADSKIRDLPRVAKKAQKSSNARLPLWPDQRFERADQLSWIAQTNRHFLFTVHPLIERSAAEANINDPKANPLDKSLNIGKQLVYAQSVVRGGQPIKGADPFDLHLEIAMQSRSTLVQPGGELDLSFGAYIGPLDDTYLRAKNDPLYGALNLKDIVVYQIGFCGLCTFQWIAKPLLALLRFFESSVVFDWGLAIILLVICVRLTLHPITKRSQVAMMRFSKQMQRLAPKQQKIKERYKDDRQRMNQELTKLMREEQINPLGMLGCLPMFLQTPIWIALYATIYFAFDLRHEPAFFGVFQNFNGWTFLNDLSSPDHFIEFSGGGFKLPVIGGLMGTITGLNILPLLMGGIFFVQQKYMSPPPTGNMSPEQENTQKIMKVMLVLMMPVFMFNAPSGLTLYILTSSTLGVLESRYIRSHVDKMDLESPPPKKPARSPGRKQVANTAFNRGPEPPRKRFKDRGKG